MHKSHYNWSLTLLLWLPFVALATLLCLIIYIAVQQDIRISANSPQIQMAEDATTALNNGLTPSSLVPASTVNISQSLSAFLAIFDESGKTQVSSGLLDGTLPSLPTGVFDYTRRNGEDRFTWQPRNNVRQAAVLIYYSSNKGISGFVLASRSLREIEALEWNLEIELFIFWIAGLVATLFFSFLFASAKSRS